MKVLNEYFLMVMFTVLLNAVHVFANVSFNLNRETWQLKLINMHTSFTRQLISDKFGALTEMA